MVSTTNISATGLKPRHFRVICDILEAHLPEGKCRVYLFGSRAGDTVRPVSDIDLAVEKISENTALHLHTIRTAFEESNLPYRVDLVNLGNIRTDLKDTIKKEGIMIWGR